MWLLITVPGSLVPLTAIAEYKEYKVKLAFIEKLTHFIDWPAQSKVLDPRQAFVFCVMGRNPFGVELEKLVGLTKLKQKTIDLKLSVTLDQAAQCDILFLAKKINVPVTAVINRVRGSPVLLVGDVPGLAEKGVLVHFYVQNERLGIEVNLKDSRKAGFSISSRLLKLARIVPSSEGMR